MNANKQDAGGLLPCPFCGGEPIQYDYADGYGIHCGNVECTIDMFATSRDSDADARAIWNRRNGELCRAAPAGGDCRGTIPQALNETINGVVSDLEMIAAGKDLVTGDPVSGLQSQRIAKSAHAILLAAWNACDSAPSGGVLDGSLQHKLAQELDSAPAGSGEVDDAEALREFTEYFVKNYPGPHTVIMDPNWHAPKIFRAAKRALLRKLQQGADYVMVPRSLAVSGAEVCAEWLDLFAETPGLDKYERYTYAPCVEITRDQFRAASQGQEGGTNG